MTLGHHGLSQESQRQKSIEAFLDEPIHRYEKAADRPEPTKAKTLTPLSFRYALATHSDSCRLEKFDERKSCLSSRRLDVDRRTDLARVLSANLASFPTHWRKDHSGRCPYRHHASLVRNSALFQAWCSGRTGYPIVDAGMRQLNQTGWMHNRVRMISRIFFDQDLRIDWQSGGSISCVICSMRMSPRQR